MDGGPVATAIHATTSVTGETGPPRSLSPFPARVQAINAPPPLLLTPAHGRGGSQPTTPGRSPPTVQHGAAPVVADFFSDCSSQASWAYLSDSRMLEVAEQMLRGLVAPELLRELDRRELVALLAAHQKVVPASVQTGPGRQIRMMSSASASSQDFSVLPTRSPSSLSARGARSPSPTVFQVSPATARALHQSASTVEMQAAGAPWMQPSVALDATAAAMMRGETASPMPTHRARMQSKRELAATAMRVPVLQSQRLLSTRNSARFGGPVGARGVAVPVMRRTTSPVVHRTASSTAVPADNAVHVVTRAVSDRSNSPIPNGSRRLVPEVSTMVAADTAAMERTLHVATVRRPSLRGKLHAQVDNGVLDSTARTEGVQFAMSRGASEIGQSQRTRARSALSGKRPKSPTARTATLTASCGARASSSRHSSIHANHTVSFVSLPDVDASQEEVVDQGIVREPATLLPCPSPSGLTSPSAICSSGTYITSESIAGVLSSSVARLDAVLADKLAAADRELSLAQGAMSRLNVTATQLLPSQAATITTTPMSTEACAEENSSGRKSEDYDNKLAAKMREIEVLQKQTEENITRLARSREVSTSPLRDRDVWHEKSATVQNGASQCLPRADEVLSHLDDLIACRESRQLMDSMASLAENIRPYTVNHGWRQVRPTCKELFDQICASNAVDELSHHQSHFYFDQLGMLLFQQPIAHLVDFDVLERFDFDGSGALTFTEAFRCIKHCLIRVYKEHGGEPMIQVEFKSPEQAGYTKIRELASGGQGSTWLAASATRGQVALKTYNKVSPNALQIDELIEEMAIMNRLDNPHIMREIEIFQDATCLYSVFELLQGGDLSRLRFNLTAAGVPLTELYFKHIFTQCMSALNFLHQHAIMHCDIKEQNLMIRNAEFRDPQVVMIDFGMSSLAAGPGVAGGTPGYRPPETNETNVWFPTGDIFSLGVTFFQLMADKVPGGERVAGIFQEGAMTIEDIVQITASRPVPVHLLRGQYPSAEPWLLKMMEKQREHRPRAAQLLAIPWFSTYEPELVHHQEFVVEGEFDLNGLMNEGLTHLLDDSRCSPAPSYDMEHVDGIDAPAM